MTAHLVALCIDANDPPRLARFWAGLLGWEIVDDRRDGVRLLPSDDTGFRIRFLPTQEQKPGPNQMHLHLTSTSLARPAGDGGPGAPSRGRHLDVGQRPEEEHVVLADPEGNEFCVIEPGNSFLAGCGFLGELACDGSQEVGYFWSEALGWPLVWDQDQETAIQSPGGGTKIAWGGPPVGPKAGKNRMHFDLAPPVDGDQQAEVDRLVSLGATRIDLGQCEAGGVRWPTPTATSSAWCPHPDNEVEPLPAAPRPTGVTTLPPRPPLRVALAVALAGAALVSCSSEEGGTGSASCPAVIEYDGHAYLGGGDLKRDPATTGRLVDGVSRSVTTRAARIHR